MPVQITNPNVLLVEGNDDVRFFRAFLTRAGLSGYDVLKTEGKTLFRSSLRALANAPGFEDVTGLAIARDADDDPQAAFQAIRDALLAVGLPAPSKPFLVEEGRPRTLVLVIAGSRGKGGIEDLCLDSVQDDPCMACVEAYFRCLSQTGVPIHPAHMAKARAQVFLASRPRPALRIGEAAEAGYSPFDHPGFGRIHAVLDELRKPAAHGLEGPRTV